MASRNRFEPLEPEMAIARLRRALGGRTGNPEAGLAWWLLAVGDPLDPDDFEARESAREKLFRQVQDAGLAPAENCWVWDDTGRAQLVLAAFPDRERAEAAALDLSSRGLNLRVAREFV